MGEIPFNETIADLCDRIATKEVEVKELIEQLNQYK